MDFDLDKLLTEVGFDEADLPAAKELFAKGERTANLGKKTLLLGDYSRKMDDLRKTEEAIATKQTALDDLISQNLNFKSEAEKAVHAAEVRATQAELRGLKAAKLAGYEDLSEVDVDDTKAKKTAPDFAELDKKYVGADALNRVAMGALEYQEALHEISLDHQELFGKPLRNAKNLREEWSKDFARDNKTTIFDTAERLFKFSEARAKRDADTKNAEFEKGWKEREAKLREEYSAIPGQVPRRLDEATSPLLRGKSKDKDPERGVKAAYASLQDRAA